MPPTLPTMAIRRNQSCPRTSSPVAPIPQPGGQVPAPCQSPASGMGWAAPPEPTQVRKQFRGPGGLLVLCGLARAPRHHVQLFVCG